MRVLIAPDSFGGTLSAAAAATAIAAGWRRAAPADRLDLAPLSDGGPGFLDVLAGALPAASRVAVPAAGPLGAPVRADLLLAPAGPAGRPTAYLESASVLGHHLIAPADRDVERASTAALAPLLTAAVECGAGNVVVGIGGTLTCDGGAGLIAALSPADRAALAARELVAATDVDNPLTGPAGAARAFAPQKGARPDAVERLETRLAAFAARSGTGLAAAPGAGAGGGLGFALLLLGARREPGLDVVGAAVGLAERVRAAGLVVTGEGRYDHASLRGKVAGGVAALAAAAGVPCVVVAGQVAVGRRERAAHGVSGAWSLADLAGSVEAAERAASELLSAAGARVARQWSRR